MKHLIQKSALILLLIVSFVTPVWSGTAGKITGIVTEKGTREPLLGANIVIVGTQLGATTDIDGRYTILDVPPGTYDIQISYIGFRKLKVSGVRVYIDQTARVDAELEAESIETPELIVVAERKAVKADVATSVVSLSSDDIKQLPVVNITDVIGMQAGIEGLSIRGGGSDQLLFLVNGVTMRDPRNNEPTTSIALSAVQEISIERGGYNAEYGQVQNGVVNVVTREGDKSKYSGRFQINMRPPGAKYYKGTSDIKDISDPMSYALRPFFDDAVCWTGTKSDAWDEYTRKQYGEFVGWNEVSRILNSDNNPNNDLTPAGAQRAFEYEIRKKQRNNRPDINIDAGFGGPVPYISQMLGNLRFYSSYRSTHEELIYPLTRPDYEDYTGMLQINSDITSNMKLHISAMQGKRYTMRGNWDGTGYYSYLRYPNEIAGAASAINSTYDLVTLFSDYNFALSDITNRSLSAKLTHTLSSSTFYEVSIENFRVVYNTRPSALRDTSQKVEVIPGFWEDSNPFGYWPDEQSGVLVTGGQHVAKPRDFSVVSSTTLKFDIMSQVNSSNLIKAGIEFGYNDLNLDYGTIASATGGKTYSSRVKERVFPVHGSLYLQDKLETKEFIMNAGLRLDYNNSNTDWYNVSSFDNGFYSSKYNDNMSFSKTASKKQVQLSPRLSISHPITENSKLFFNYGHFKQTPNYESMFRIQRNDQQKMSSMGDPNMILSKTISYELGFDYSIDNLLLLQLAGYYNDVTDQQSYTNYLSSTSDINYTLTTANNYSDTRGFELTVRKTGGDWITGFANYTYRVTTSGHFGSANQYDNIPEQKKYDQATQNLYQNRPIPQPIARINVRFFTPDDFGPEVLGHTILSGLAVNARFDWQEGYWTTWNPKGKAAISYNVQALDYYNLNLRFEKSISFKNFSIELFMDINNALNTLRLWNTGDQDYLRSLHFPKSEAYDNLVGNDKVGDYRKLGVEFQPIEYQSTIDLTKSGKTRPIYYEGSTGKYWQYANGNWSEADANKVKQVLDDKAYIDMPNASTFWFLNPRNFYFGINVSFNL